MHVFGFEPLEHAGIARRKQGEVGLLLVAYEGLSQNLLRCVDDSVFEAQEKIEVAKAKIGIQYNGFLTLPGQGNAQIGCEGRFADTAFARADQDRSRGWRHGVPGSQGSLKGVSHSGQGIVPLCCRNDRGQWLGGFNHDFSIHDAGLLRKARLRLLVRSTGNAISDP